MLNLNLSKYIVTRLLHYIAGQITRMVRTIIESTEDVFVLPIPPEYKGKKLEVIYYSLDELSENISTVNDPASIAKYKGLISVEEAEQLKKHIQKSRSEWDRPI